MTVSQLIEVLNKMPSNAEIGIIYDGAVRKGADTAFLTNEGTVALYEFGDMIYYDTDRPIGSKNEHQDNILN
jgi:hypothetical protein